MTRTKEPGCIPFQRSGINSQTAARWELVYEIAQHLPGSWKIGASGLQSLGHLKGSVSGPNDMQLFFTARSQKLDPRMEASCPRLGWVRVDGQFPSSADWDRTFEDGIYRPTPKSELSIELPEA